MSRATKGCFYAGLGLGLALGPGASAGEPAPAISVHVYNYAKLSADVLAASERQAARIFSRAGLKTEWIACPLAPAEVSLYPECTTPAKGTKLALRLLSRQMAVALGQPSVCFGVAFLADDGRFGSLAVVFPFKAEELARQKSPVPTAVMLGHLFAHELGHLLLGSRSHTASGIMRASWYGYDQLLLMAHGAVSFNSRQRKAIHEQLNRRQLSESARTDVD